MKGLNTIAIVLAGVVIWWTFFKKDSNAVDIGSVVNAKKDNPDEVDLLGELQKRFTVSVPDSVENLGQELRADDTEAICGEDGWCKVGLQRYPDWFALDILGLRKAE